jgi:hypothetical protein
LRYVRACRALSVNRVLAGEKADDIYPEHRAFVELAFQRLER